MKRTIKQSKPESNPVNCTQANYRNFNTDVCKVLTVRLNSEDLASQTRERRSEANWKKPNKL